MQWSRLIHDALGRTGETESGRRYCFPRASLGAVFIQSSALRSGSNVHAREHLNQVSCARRQLKRIGTSYPK